jgi:NAD(P)H dehydrogenase (quinone)
MPDPKANILVAFYSRDGSVEALAKAVSEGARAAGAEVRLRRVPDIVSPAVMAKVPGWEERSERMLAEYGAPTPADAEWADGIIFGTPTRFGNTSAGLKAFIDSLGGLWFQGKLNGKAASAFTSTAGPHGGNETTVVSLYIPMAHWGSPSCRPATLTKRLFRATGRHTERPRFLDRTARRRQQTILRLPSIRGHASRKWPQL